MLPRVAHSYTSNNLYWLLPCHVTALSQSDAHLIETPLPVFMFEFLFPIRLAQCSTGFRLNVPPSCRRCSSNDVLPMPWMPTTISFKRAYGFEFSWIDLGKNDNILRLCWLVVGQWRASKAGFGSKMLKLMRPKINPLIIQIIPTLQEWMFLT